MRTREEVASLLLREARPVRRRLYFAALLAQEVRNPRPSLVVVGGSAIEIYSEGEYVSGDIDIVGPRKDLVDTLARWGFLEDGRLWHDAKLGLAVDLVGSEYTGDIHRTREISTPFGPVRVAAIEDLIVKRLASSQHWKIPGDVGQALLLAAAYEREIDWEYAEHAAAHYRVTNLLAALRDSLRQRR
jgi:hypothetical protein